MRQLKISIVGLAALLTTACASKNKVDDSTSAQAPAAIAAPAPAPEAAVPAITHEGVSAAVCDKNKDHRTLDLRTKGAGCEAVYTKGGQAAVVAHGQHGVGNCERALKKIKQKLVAGGYTCQ